MSQCAARIKNGERCTQPHERDSEFCRRHSGGDAVRYEPTPVELAEERVRVIRARIRRRKIMVKKVLHGKAGALELARHMLAEASDQCSDLELSFPDTSPAAARMRAMGVEALRQAARLIVEVEATIAPVQEDEGQPEIKVTLEHVTTTTADIHAAATGVASGEE